MAVETQQPLRKVQYAHIDSRSADPISAVPRLMNTDGEAHASAKRTHQRVCTVPRPGKLNDTMQRTAVAPQSDASPAVARPRTSRLVAAIWTSERPWWRAREPVEPVSIT